MIKIDFEFETVHGKYADALHLPDDHSFTDDEIEGMKQDRLNNWISIITTVPEHVPEVPVDPIVLAADSVEIAGETYMKLTGVPMTGAKLVEISGIWYYKV